MLIVDDLVKSYDGASGRKRGAGARVHAVGGASFEVHTGELFTLLGPSGCGKTTTLRSIAGLERPDRGRIVLSGRPLFDAAAGVNLPANRRELGMVFQSYAIWPHMSVFKNVSFPLDVLPRKRRPARREIAERVERVLEVTELSDYAARPATKLSGGQQQRLALARALVIQPDLMLLDEPLSNLDAKLRENMRFELKRLQRELGLTAIYVTHDQSEALVMSSRIAVMHKGNIEQVGKPREIYTNPASKFVAEFIGTSNFVKGVVASAEGGEITVDTIEGRVVCRGATAAPAAGEDVLLSIRPECLVLSGSPSPGAVNDWSGQVRTRAFLGDAVDHVVEVGKMEIRVRCNPTQSIEPGTRVHLSVDPAKVTLVPVG
ncbi:ABC transporter ATP-binding protein [Amycolatopsis acidiphila]|uniref:ABC transporter ATP-binding protein n=1 Tax=Amycolatopsis acidiphila TaxID=715473 RepID=A0A558AF94_9PSEU|nr:ABC transporter ATP-binding protein [Amycolatopsis acidiphila]TVT22938.1 ABC transporter ATP-binding protein [Amycolatopsis acidiphila]UIJ57098.1 ABC transporter ATP-binding protein [Amycolatopsis acidiphila]GHG53368.1 ABC transporter ATP-binding protein [Amycolatopsis acidiphila]